MRQPLSPSMASLASGNCDTAVNVQSSTYTASSVPKVIGRFHEFGFAFGLSRTNKASRPPLHVQVSITPYAPSPCVRSPGELIQIDQRSGTD